MLKIKNEQKIEEIEQNEQKIEEIEDIEEKLRRFEEHNCEICNYKTTRIDNFKRHNTSKRHITNMNNNKVIEKEKNERINITNTISKDTQLQTRTQQSTEFICEICNYKTKRKVNYNRHIISKTHHKKSEKSYNTIKNTIKKCEFCNKEYKSKSGYYKHQRVCERKKNSELNEMKNIILELTKKNDMLYDIIKEPKIQIHNNVNNVKNVNNVTNIENFLNIDCKDAINMTDFIHQIHNTLQDILYLGDNGFSKSIERVFLTSLKDMDTTKRPIHCTNKKKKTLYIKDDNVWEKDKEHKKMKQVINVFHKKQLNDALSIMDKHIDYFKDYDNLPKKNNIIISLTNVNKDNTLKTLTKTITKDMCLL